jgi:hypothetical protein
MRASVRYEEIERAFVPVNEDVEAALFVCPDEEVRDSTLHVL